MRLDGERLPPYPTPALASAEIIPNAMKSARFHLASIFLPSLGFLLAGPLPSHGVLVALPSATLSPPMVDQAIVVDFGEVSISTPIHNQTIKGYTFSENIPNATTTNLGPGTTLNLNGVSLQSGGEYSPANYVLTVTMPIPVHGFGFGYSILDPSPVANAVTITVFNGLTNLGAITYPGTPDPLFTGGFAGVGSTDYFTSVKINFGPTAAAFAIDNLAVPEPGSLALLLLGGAALGLRRQRQTARV